MARKKSSYRVRSCHCIEERGGGGHVYKWCYRTKNTARAALKVMRKRYPSSKLRLRSGTCYKKDVRKHSSRVW